MSAGGFLPTSKVPVSGRVMGPGGLYWRSRWLQSPVPTGVQRLHVLKKRGQRASPFGLHFVLLVPFQTQASEERQTGVWRTCGFEDEGPANKEVAASLMKACQPVYCAGNRSSVNVQPQSLLHDLRNGD